MSAFVDRIDHPTIPALPAVLNPAELGEHLRQALPSQTEGLKEIKVRLLRHHVGKRCVVEITLATMEGVRCLIGKAYAKDRFDVGALGVADRRHDPPLVAVGQAVEEPPGFGVPIQGIVQVGRYGHLAGCRVLAFA